MDFLHSWDQFFKWKSSYAHEITTKSNSGGEKSLARYFWQIPIPGNIWQRSQQLHRQTIQVVYQIYFLFIKREAQNARKSKSQKFVSLSAKVYISLYCLRYSNSRLFLNHYACASCLALFFGCKMAGTSYSGF